MYEQNRKSINAFVGCNHDCVYCIPSFQRQMKRRKKACIKCYDYEPHVHPERLLKAPPKTVGDEFIFFPSSGDLSFASPLGVQAHIDYANKYSDRRFLIQTKDPEFLDNYKFPENVILGITLETDRRVYFTPSLFKTYERISKAPIPMFRNADFRQIKHPHKYVTIEPILQFRHSLVHWIYRINPEVVYVGYDNHDCRLPEPRLQDTERLISELEKFTTVRRKTIRKAWYEGVY